jgi:prepilin signal peptidase PulO-like enzyme (type II secretory pathway)
LFQLKILPDLKSKKHWGSILNIDVFIFSLLITTTFLVFLIFLDKKKYFHPDLKIIFLFTGVYFINLIISSFHKPENNPQYRAMKEVIFILCYIIIILLCIYVFLQVIHL